MGDKKLSESAFQSKKIYAVFDGSRSLSDLCLELLSDQKKTWPDLQKGYGELSNIKERDLPCQGFSVRLQHNPLRIKSSTADANKTEGGKKPCFLCLDRLPENQRGILYRNDYLILGNPMPVFSLHFTVSHVDHRAQGLEAYVQIFLQLSSDLGPGWMVLYNGPRCGASAPDHLHFQIAPSGRMPIEKEILEKKKLSPIKVADQVFFARGKDLGREIVVLEGRNPQAVEHVLKDFLQALRKVLSVNEEPMINVAGFCEEGKWRLLIFPRRKHRPHLFFMEGEDRVIISPGVIDMAGLLIVPVEKDFQRIDRPLIEGIYKEVSLEEDAVGRAIGEMRRNSGNPKP